MQITERNNLASYRVEYSSMHNDRNILIVTEWDNGEGYSLYLDSHKAQTIDLHYDDILAMRAVFDRIVEAWEK